MNYKKLIACLMIMGLTFSGWAAEKNQSEGVRAVTAVSQRGLRVGDTLNITVWQHKDLSTTLVVDEGGNIEYLFLGVIPVAGKTLTEVKEILKKGISDNYIVDPKVDISMDRKSLTFFVTGEVLKPGTYEFHPGVSVLEAIALAGGFTDYASRKIKVIRKTGDGKEKEIKINTKKLLRATDKREESRVQVDDILVVERAWW